MKFMPNFNDIYVGREEMKNIKHQTSNIKMNLKPQTSNLKNLISLKLGFVICFVVCSLGSGVLFPASQSFADNIIVSDPMYIGVSARSLGMGKAYVAVAEDGDALFMNPAGIAKAKSPKLTSMYSSVMGDVNYMVIGGIYPQSQNSAVGAGAVVSSVPGIDLRDPSGTALGSANWNSSVLFLSYGANTEDSKFGIGGSLKYYSQGGTGSASIESASASGIGLDVGALYRVNENLTLGINAQNPVSTKMQSGNSVENVIDPLIKTGLSYKIKPNDNQKLTLAADIDLPKNGKTLGHAGAEYQISPNFTLRGGVDQNMVGSGVETNPTAGLGIKTGGMQFDYAYHPYGSIADTATHYFSISYVGDQKETAMEEAELSVALAEPKDKTVIYNDSVSVKGSVKGASNVLINGLAVPVDIKGNFSAEVPVSKYGKKLVLVEAISPKGKSVQASAKVLRLVNFADVSENYWAKGPIEGSSTVGLIQGYPDGTFKPERVLTRAELATLLVRAKGGEVASANESVFKDVEQDNWAAPYIKEAVNMGLVKGYPDGRFRPNRRLSKAEAITVLVRYDKLPLNPVAGNPYSDVTAKHWAAKQVQAAKDAGYLSYIDTQKLGLKQDVSRAEIVQMMSKTSVAGNLINELYSWEKGYELERSKPVIKAGL